MLSRWLKTKKALSDITETDGSVALSKGGIFLSGDN